MLSGNRNFEGRVHPEIKMNFLASPPLVVAYALAGHLDVDITTEPLGTGKRRQAGVPEGHLAERRGGGRRRWQARSTRRCSRKGYADVFAGDERWQRHQDAGRQDLRLGCQVHLRQESALLRRHDHDAGRGRPISKARACWRVLGDSVTTDHISPAGNIAKTSPAAQVPDGAGRAAGGLQSYGARRGNHEVMMRGTFANIRLRNLLLPGTEGGVTLHIPSGEQMSIFDAAMRYKSDGTPLDHPRRQGIRHRLARATGPPRARCCWA